MSDALKRAVRTALQAGIGLFVLLVVPFLQEVLEWASGSTAEFPDASVLGRAGVAFVAGVFISLLSWLQNLGEDKGTFPSLFKETPASRYMREVTNAQDESGQSEIRLVIGVLLIVLLVLVIIQLA